MKKTILSLFTVALFFFAVPTQSIAEETTGKTAVEETNAEAVAEAKADINQMVDRVKEISEMDIESLTRAEKKELRKEVRTIKKDLNAYSKSDSPAVAEAAAAASAEATGIYISAGAIIIILLLIILL